MPSNPAVLILVAAALALTAAFTAHARTEPGDPTKPVPHYAKIPAGFQPAGTPLAEGAESRLRTATFGAGCFWGAEAAFRKVGGVTHTAVGFEGGRKQGASYEEVCTDATGHAEVVEVLYDPELVSYDDLLRVFWDNHNPTTLNRQGPDIGTQYRSVIFYHDDEQRRAAERSMKALAASGKWGDRPIVTEIAPAAPFTIADEHHQQYLEKRGLASCHN